MKSIITLAFVFVFSSSFSTPKEVPKAGKKYSDIGMFFNPDFILVINQYISPAASAKNTVMLNILEGESLIYMPRRVALSAADSIQDNAYVPELSDATLRRPLPDYGNGHCFLAFEITGQLPWYAYLLEFDNIPWHSAADFGYGPAWDTNQWAIDNMFVDDFLEVNFYVKEGSAVEDPIAGAVVTADGQQATTKLDGVAGIILPVGDYIATIVAEGYEAKSVAFTVVDEDKTIDLHMVDVIVEPSHQTQTDECFEAELKSLNHEENLYFNAYLNGFLCFCAKRDCFIGKPIR